MAGKGNSKRMRERVIVILTALQYGPLSRDALIQRVIAQWGTEAYGDAPEDAFEHDKKYLKSLGFELHYDRQTNVYQLEPRNPLLRLPLSREEGRLLALIRRAFRSTPYAHDIERLMALLVAHLPPDVQAEADRDPPLQIILAAADDLNPHHASFQAVERAIHENRELEFDYQSPRTSEPKHHRIQPYDSLEFRDGHFYFSGYNVRTGYSYEYRVDRIVAGTARVLPQKFAPSQPKARRLTLRYQLKAEIASYGASRRFPGHQETRLPNGDVMVTAKIGEDDLFWATKTLLRYGENCEVLEPPELVAELRRIVTEMARVYGGEGDEAR